jgi:hypothetical protein
MIGEAFAEEREDHPSNLIIDNTDETAAIVIEPRHRRCLGGRMGRPARIAEHDLRAHVLTRPLVVIEHTEVHNPDCSPAIG